MNEIQVFRFQNNSVRTHVDEAGNPWWVAKDVCRVLGIVKYRDAAARLDEDESMPLRVDASGEITTCISESGLYSLILRSQKPDAKKFKKWITSQVLPEIRKTGGYSANQAEWLAARNQGKLVRKITTDIISAFIDYAKSQGSQSAEKYYMNFSRMVNDSLLEIEGKKPSNLRDELNVIQLHQVSVAENIISKSIVECIGKQLPYKEIYQISKQKISAYASTIGRSKLGQSERQVVGLLA